MFDIGWSEFLVIAVVALIAIGPKELRGRAAHGRQWMGKARKMPPNSRASSRRRCERDRNGRPQKELR